MSEPRPGTKLAHLHISDHDKYRHDHSLFTLSQLRRHLDAQHQPRLLPICRLMPRWARERLNLDTGQIEEDVR